MTKYSKGSKAKVVQEYTQRLFLKRQGLISSEYRKQALAS